jgi:hypothetical protein
MRYFAGLAIVLAACTSATGSPTSTEQPTAPTTAGLPCVSASGVISGDMSVTVETDDQEVAAVLGWVNAEPCSGDGAGVVSDGFFEGLDDAVLAMEGDDTVRVHAPAFGEADFEAVWEAADGSEVAADATKVEAGVWEILESPPADGTHILGLRFDYGDDLDAAFAVTVDLQD